MADVTGRGWFVGGLLIGDELRQWQMHRELSPVAEAPADGYVTVMQPSQGPRDVEAKTDAVDCTVPDFPTPFEPLEELLGLPRIDPDAAVSDGDPGLVVSHLQTAVDRAAIWRVLDCVVDQVADDGCHTLGIHVGHDREP